jgi:hypothetical protein
MTSPFFALRCRALVAALALAAAAAVAATPPPAPASAAASSDGDEAGELIGDLVFHADLLTALDRLCPRSGGVGADWHGALKSLLEQAFTPELRSLSRKLGADAGASLVQQRGGCHTRGFAAAYDESRGEYRALLQRWQALDD